MELDDYNLLSFPTIAITVLTILILWKSLRRGSRKRANLPPGPPRLPFIGNLHQLAFGLPHHKLHKLAEKYGPVMHLQLGQISTVVVSSPEAAKVVMRTHDDVFASRPNLLVGQMLFYDSTDINFAPYGDYWKKVKNICMVELLTAKRVQSFKRIREEVMTSYIKSISKTSGPVNLTKIMLEITNRIVGRTALGLKGNDVDAFAELIGEAIKMTSQSGAADTFPSVKMVEVITGIKRRMKEMCEKYDKVLEDIINVHRAKIHVRRSKELEETGVPGDEEEDLVDILLKFENDSNSEFSLTTNNIKALLLDMWMGAIETSAAVVEWAMAEMMKNPHVMKKAQDEVRQVFQGKGTVDESDFHKLEYLKLVIKETLRLRPTIPLLVPRESLEHCKIFGYDIPAKTRVLVNAWAIARDPKFWPNPESFEPERYLETSIDYKGNNLELIPFGAGRRMCPGISYGLAIVEIELAMFLYHFDWKLPGGLKSQDFDMDERFGISVRKKQELHIIPTPYPDSLIA